jgi:hypothetical protein
LFLLEEGVAGSALVVRLEVLAVQAFRYLCPTPLVTLGGLAEVTTAAAAGAQEAELQATWALEEMQQPFPAGTLAHLALEVAVEVAVAMRC